MATQTSHAQSSIAGGVDSVPMATGGGSSSMFLTAGAFDPRLSARIVVQLDATHLVARFDFRTLKSFQDYVRPFESVLLDSVNVSAALSPGLHCLVQYGVDGNHVNPTEISSCAIYGILGGGSVGYAEREFILSGSSRFGRELKAKVLGNPTPVIHIGVANLFKNQVVILNVEVNFTVAGNAPPASLGYTKITPPTADFLDVESADPEDAHADDSTNPPDD